MEGSIRPAGADDLGGVAEVMIASRRANIPAIPPPVHSDAEIRRWIGDVVFPACEVWVVNAGDSPINAILVLTPGWVEHLYVRPGHTGRGVGTELVRFAQNRTDDTLDLWTFVSNTGARRFYGRHGFVEIDRTDGDNEEGEPDVRMRWVRDPRRT